MHSDHKEAMKLAWKQGYETILELQGDGAHSAVVTANQRSR